MTKEAFKMSLDCEINFIHGGESGDLVATPDMCYYCFDILIRTLLHGSTHEVVNKLNAETFDHEKHHPNPESSNYDSKNSVARSIKDDIGLNSAQKYIPPAVECPLFVTWEKRRSCLASSLSRTSSGFTSPASSNISSDNDHDDQDYSEFDLRGCIGTLTPRPLRYALSEFTLSSAFKDRRFGPISVHELRSLRVGVSLLVKYENCIDCMDWKVGTHGIIIKFETRIEGRNSEEKYCATYLPEVASEQRWNQEATVFSLIRKAGYRGPISNFLLKNIQCTRYQSSKCRISYDEYVLSKCAGVDPLRSKDLIPSLAVDRAMKQRVKSYKICANL